MNNTTPLPIILAACALFFLGRAQADCAITSGSASLGEISSFSVYSTAQTTQASSGFSCTGSLLTLLSNNTITATLASSSFASTTTPRMYSAATSEYIPYSVCKDASCGETYPIGHAMEWKSTTFLGILGLFSAADGTLPLYIRTTPGANVAAGTYNDMLTISWKWSLCSLGALGLCIYDTGTRTSTLAVNMVVMKDCSIVSALDVDFGSAALPSAFASVSGNTIIVQCTKNTPYSINLSGTNDLSNWRQMASAQSGTTRYLQYQFSRPSGTIWTQYNDYASNGTGLAQNIVYTAAINSSQAPVPAGTYTDTVTITLTY
ncbi:Csu type fimbrial protein [Dickeya dadantii]|uniref:Csu type fimbrial protein n=1 Tax=Dickeya dadantii TaxID=204038 RepID=UPI001C0D6CC8|nr:spore coat protein U domain-containing protein [Dickeya dadantii]QWT41589.1 spore coat U domain-containing protein [Dickeya dadantii]